MRHILIIISFLLLSSPVIGQSGKTSDNHYRGIVVISMSSAIHFFHANGFPVETYNDLLNNLEGQVVSPISILGEGIQTVYEGYEDFVDEVIEHASKTKGEGVAIGHSFGATLSLLAEERQPGLFKNSHTFRSSFVQQDKDDHSQYLEKTWIGVSGYSC